MTAEVISVGTELLMGQIADTNAQHLGRLFPELGITHRYRQTVGDNLERVVEALRLARSRSDVVFTIGGLGPTEDDLTREGIAGYLGVDIETDEEYAAKLERMFRQRNLPWLESQRRQAMRPVGATMVENPNGSAPGLICPDGEGFIIALPGPKGEFVPMADGPIRDFLALRATGEVIHSRILRVCGLGESVVEDRIRALLDSANPTVAPYAKPGEVHLRLTARAATLKAANGMLDPLEADIRHLLGWHVFGSDETTLEAACVEALTQRGLTLGTAESITGGGLGRRITNVPGSSSVFKGGIVAYTPATKTALLGVSESILKTHGPVSSECAQAMAEGARRALGADVALSTTGNAGPAADVDGKPVGLVYLALATPTGTEVEEFKFRSTRNETRDRAAQFALTMLYRWLTSTE